MIAGREQLLDEPDSGTVELDVGRAQALTGPTAAQIGFDVQGMFADGSDPAR